MLKIGLTGGIGSGKTEVANLFAKLGVPIIDTDQIARDVVLPNTKGWQAIVAHFGPEIVDSHHQTINRRMLREKIFADHQQKTWLENLLHPLIRQAVDKTVNALHADYCILVIPLLFESTHDYKLDRILVVDTSEQQQIDRVTSRDDVSREHVEQIMRHQLSRNERSLRADDTIENISNDLNKLRHQVENLHNTYMLLSQQKKSR